MAEEKSFFKKTEVLAIAAVIIFLVGFLAFNQFKQQEYNVLGMKVVSEQKPGDALKTFLAKKSFVIELHLTGETSVENSVIARAASEVTGILGFYNKSVNIYGIVDGKPEINCVANNSFCSNPGITFKTGSCDCMKITDSVLIEGSQEFLDKHKITVRRIFDGVLSQTR